MSNVSINDIVGMEGRIKQHMDHSIDRVNDRIDRIEDKIADIDKAPQPEAKSEPRFDPIKLVLGVVLINFAIDIGNKIFDTDVQEIEVPNVSGALEIPPAYAQPPTGTN